MATEDTELQKGMIDPNSTQAADQTRYVLTGLFVCLVFFFIYSYNYKGVPINCKKIFE